MLIHGEKDLKILLPEGFMQGLILRSGRKCWNLSLTISP